MPFFRSPLLFKSAIVVLLVSGVLIANSGGPQLGLTGGFGEPNCTQCHTGNPLNAPGGSVTLSGLPETGYTPNQNYSVTVALARGGQSRWGFELATRIQANGNQAGALTAGTGTQVRTNGSTGVQYISHTAAGTFPGQRDSGSWTFTWRAPGPGSGPVQINVAGNAANNNGAPSGDFIYTGQLVVPEVTATPGCSQPNNTNFAQFANGGGFTSKVILTNPGSSPVDACMDVRNDGGNPVTVGMASDPSGINPGGSFTIPPGGSVVFTSDGQGDLTVGSVRVGSSGTIGGVVLFAFSGGTTGVGSSVSLSGFITPVERNANVNTGLALMNTTDAAVTVNLSLRRLDGTEAAVGSVTIPARGHSQGFISDYFGDGATQNFRGSVVARTASGTVGATALRIGNEFTTLPVTPLP